MGTCRERLPRFRCNCYRDLPDALADCQHRYHCDRLQARREDHLGDGAHPGVAMVEAVSPHSAGRGSLTVFRQLLVGVRELGMRL
jgi:hypothetical protein